MENEIDGLSLLALDGGGIRGLSELFVLEEIMKRIQTEEGLKEMPKPCEYFDIIGGTSMGGLIAILLGRLCMSVEEAIKEYIHLTGKVFSETKLIWQDEKFKASILEAAVKDVVARYDESGDENARMMDNGSSRRQHKTFVCTTSVSTLNLAHPRFVPQLFRSYDVRSNTAFNPTIWEAARATTAVRTLFKPISIGDDPKEEFVDGGWRCNNPTAEVLREAQMIFGADHPISCIVNLGAGHLASNILHKPEMFQWTLPMGLVKVLMDISTDCEALAEDFERKYLNWNERTRKTYFRFNVQQGLQEASLSEWMRMSEVKTHTLQYLRGTAVGVEIDRLRDVLRVKKGRLEGRLEHLEKSNRPLPPSVSGPNHGSASIQTPNNVLTRFHLPYTNASTSQSQETLVEIPKTTSLNIILHQHYKRLLSCGEDDAQKVLDVFQTLLDIESFQDRGQIAAAMRKLSERTNLYPTRLLLKIPPPSFEDPITAGSLTDIYRIVLDGEDTCFKTVRVYQRSHVEHMVKVYAREAILWAQLSHPNVLPFYGLVQLGPRLSFVSRWAEKGNLDEYLAHNPDANRLLLCLDTAAGVEYLHKNDIVHGDLRGLNVLIDTSGRAALGDFGLASVTDPQILKWSTQSTMVSRGETVRWQAPEYLSFEDGSGKVYNSKASDVFAWANVCYEIFTGRLPYCEILNPTSVMLHILAGGTPTRPQDDDPAWLERGLNNRIWDAMEECWNLQPSKRPDMISLTLRIGLETPPDSRPPGEWAERVAMRFRNAQDEKLSEDNIPLSWGELDSLLGRIVPGIR